MAVVYEPATDLVYPNLTIKRRYTGGIFSGYELTANEGYAFYDSSEHLTETDPDTMRDIPVTYYRTIASLPNNYNFANFPYVAVPRDSVDGSEAET